jgi:hypothetical protein
MPTMRLYPFLIQSDENGVVGHALVCPIARYAAFKWHAESQLHYRRGTDELWARVDAEVSQPTTPAPWPTDSALSELVIEPFRRQVLVLQVCGDIFDEPALPIASSIRELDECLRGLDWGPQA